MAGVIGLRSVGHDRTAVYHGSWAGRGGRADTLRGRQHHERIGACILSLAVGRASKHDWTVNDGCWAEWAARPETPITTTTTA